VGLFDGVIATAFQRDAEGRAVFCPWGMRRRCYLLTAEQDVEIRRFLRAYYGGFFVVLVPGAWFLGWWVLLVSVVAIGGLQLKYWLVTRDLKPFAGAIPPVSAEEMLSQHARATGRGALMALLVVSVGLAGWSLWLNIAGDRTIAALFVTVCLVGVSVMVGMQLRRAR
jgi:hypothetical protein